MPAILVCFQRYIATGAVALLVEILRIDGQRHTGRRQIQLE